MHSALGAFEIVREIIWNSAHKHCETDSGDRYAMVHCLDTSKSLAGRRSSRSVLLALLLTFFVGMAMPTRVLAQGDGEAKTAAEAKTDAKAADAPSEESYLIFLLKASGVFGFLILLCSFIMVALIIMNGMKIRRDNFVPAAFIEDFEAKLNAKDYQGAFEIAKNDESFAAKVLAGGMAKLNRGYEEAVVGMQEAGDDENMALEHNLSYLGLLGTIAPMLGLLGTVQGMVSSFQVIAQGGSTPKPSDLAKGVATALVTTLEGLVVAIPAIFFFAFFKNRMQRFVFETGIVTEGLMNRFSGVGKTQPAAPPRPAGGAAPAGAPAAPQE